MENTKINKLLKMGEKKYCFHIGFPKTGTTTLQEYLFSKHSQVSYLGKPYPQKDIENEINKLIKEESIVYNDEKIHELLEEIKKKSNKKVILLSDEIIVSSAKVRDKGLVAERINKVFGNCKIVITIRNQKELLKSAYINGERLIKYVPEKFNGIAISFDEWLKSAHKNIQRSYIGNIQFYDTINYYQNLFGKENVLVLLFEDFASNKIEFIQKLTDFIGIDFDESLDLIKKKHSNKRMSQAQLDFELFKTKFFIFYKIPLFPFLFKLYYSFLKILKKGKKAKVFYSNEWEKEISSIYKEGNKKLKEEFNLPLEKYDYPI